METALAPSQCHKILARASNRNRLRRSSVGSYPNAGGVAKSPQLKKAVGSSLFFMLSRIDEGMLRPQSSGTRGNDVKRLYAIVR